MDSILSFTSAVIRKVYLIFVMLAFIACNHSLKEARRERVNTINGKMVYFFNKEGIQGLACKESYMTDDFQILINSDSIDLGSEFVSRINIPKDSYRITITSPTTEIITRDGAHEAKVYHYKTAREGTYDFRGQIEYDTVIFPFEYKFIVRAKKADD